MVLTISFHHNDIDQALRLMRWMAFLSKQNGDDLERETIFLEPSQLVCSHPRYKPLIEAAQATFGTCLVYSPPSYEHGWPDSCNYMFARALEYVESKGYGDMFWIEPDCVLLTHTWLQQIRNEWETVKAKGKRFMGGFVPRPFPHMNGNGIYASNWRELAPELVKTPNGKTWDMHSAKSIVPHLHNSLLFHHIWRAKYAKVVTPRPDAVFFHQDKTGKLIKELDSVKYKGECFQGQNDIIEQIDFMPKYFKSANASSPQRVGSIEIRFTPCVQSGSHWTGVFVTADEKEEAALQDICARKPSVVEIQEPEYKALLAQKKTTSYLIPFDPSRINPLGVKPAAKTAQNAPVPNNLTLADVVKTGKVEPAQPQDGPVKGRTKVVSANKG